MRGVRQIACDAHASTTSTATGMFAFGGNGDIVHSIFMASIEHFELEM